MVEHLLAKEKVAGSNPVFRSSVTRAASRVFSCTPIGTNGMLSVGDLANAGVAERQTLRS